MSLLDLGIEEKLSGQLLYKQKHKWRSVWCEQGNLKGNLKALFCYSSEATKIKEGPIVYIEVYKIKDVRANIIENDSHSKEGRYCFEIVVEQKHYLFQSKTPSGRSYWVSRLRAFVDNSYTDKTEYEESAAEAPNVPSVDMNKFHEIVAQTVKFSLDELDFSRAGLTTWPPVDTSVLHSRITEIDISYNSFTRIPENIKNFQKVRKLVLSKNQLSVFPTAALSLPHLRELILSGNKISNIPAKIGMGTLIEVLDVSGNSDLSEVSDSICDWEFLKTLKMSCCNVEKLPQRLGSLKNLTYLDVSFNRLTTLPDEFGRLTNLIFCNLKANYLSNLPNSLCCCKSLATKKGLIFDQNPFDKDKNINNIFDTESILNYLQQRAKDAGETFYWLEKSPTHVSDKNNNQGDETIRILRNWITECIRNILPKINRILQTVESTFVTIKDAAPTVQLIKSIVKELEVPAIVSQVPPFAKEKPPTSSEQDKLSALRKLATHTLEEVTWNLTQIDLICASSSDINFLLSVAKCLKPVVGFLPDSQVMPNIIVSKAKDEIPISNPPELIDNFRSTLPKRPLSPVKPTESRSPRSLSPNVRSPIENRAISPIIRTPERTLKSPFPPDHPPPLRTSNEIPVPQESRSRASSSSPRSTFSLSPRSIDRDISKDIEAMNLNLIQQKNLISEQESSRLKLERSVQQIEKELLEMEREEREYQRRESIWLSGETEKYRELKSTLDERETQLRNFQRKLLKKKKLALTDKITARHYQILLDKVKGSGAVKKRDVQSALHEILRKNQEYVNCVSQMEDTQYSYAFNEKTKVFLTNELSFVEDEKVVRSELTELMNLRKVQMEKLRKILEDKRKVLVNALGDREKELEEMKELLEMEADNSLEESRLREIKEKELEDVLEE